jgi:hypothetical protein
MPGVAVGSVDVTRFARGAVVGRVNLRLVQKSRYESFFIENDQLALPAREHLFHGSAGASQHTIPTPVDTGPPSNLRWAGDVLTESGAGCSTIVFSGGTMRIDGKCACGGLTFRVDADPILQLYCHCRSCQLAHAAPLVAAALFPARGVSYEGSFRVITVTDRKDASRRITCAACGTKVVAEPPPPVRAVFPMLCTSTDWFKPTMHIQWRDRILDVRDDLPKFLDYPKDLGGSGARA